MLNFNPNLLQGEAFNKLKHLQHAKFIMRRPKWPY